MSLTFIYGNSGCGKSEHIYQYITEQAAAFPYQRFFVVVPEQFTMHSQRRLTQHSSEGVILNVDVVSFERLAYRVFDELGIHPAVMEETGKSLVLRRIVAEQEKELTVLKGNLKKMGYIGELKSMISELMQYGISSSDLQHYLDEDKESSALHYKLRDILSVYQSFEAFLKDHYVTAEKVPELLMEVADSSSLLEGAVIVFDGYTGFTPVQMKLIQRLMTIVKEMYVTVTLDTRESLYQNPEIQNLFYMSHKMVRALTKSANESGFPIEDPIMLEANESSRLHDNPVLHSLEQNLFRTKIHPYQESCQDRLGIYSLGSPRQELTFAAVRIQQLVRDCGYRYRDFAIVSSDASVYANYADEIFHLYEVPFFADQKQTILYHPLIELIRSILEIIETDYSYESVFRYLRTGLTGFLPEEIDLLENYCIEKGIHGAKKWEKHFLKPFLQHGRIKPDEEALREELGLLNRLRGSLYDQTHPIWEAFHQKDATVKTLSTALYEFLTGLKVEDQIHLAQERFEETGEDILASEYRQIYRIVMDLLDKMVDLLGEEVLSVKDYTDILEAGFSAAKVGSIPPGNDCVILGDIERTRLDGIKVLFFLGVNEGQIPKNMSVGGLLSQYDRERLLQNDLELAPTAREQIFLQRFYLYLNMTKPSDALYILYARMDQEGKTARPSYLISTLKNLFPEINVQEIETDRPLPAVRPKSSIQTWLSGLLLARKGLILPEWKALHKWFRSQPDWYDVVEKLYQANFEAFTSESLESDLAKALYGAVLTNSVTRLELFAKCEFAHFLEYGLKLADRREFTFASLDMGSMFHAILQGYCTRLERTYDWETITESQQESLLNEAMEEAILAMPNESLLESARSAYVLERIHRIMRRSIWALTEQIRRGDFRPEGYEVEFTQVDQLDVQSMMRTVGRVDRVDTYENDGRVYVRVIDYKSGNNTFQLLSLYHGLQLQLVMYLDAAAKKLQKEHPDKEIAPAGIFYYHLDDPLLEGTEDSEEAVMEGILNKLRLNGLVSMEPEAYLHMDRELPIKKKSNIIPVTLNKDQSLSKRGTAAASTEQFGQLISYVERQISHTAQAIVRGGIAIDPYQLKDKTGCDYCGYRAICGFDLKIPGYRYAPKEDLNEQELWERIRRENEKEV